MGYTASGSTETDPLAFLTERSQTAPLSVAAFQALIDRQAAYAPIALAASRLDDRFWADAEERCREVLHLRGGNLAAFQDAVSTWIDFSYEYLVKQRFFLKKGHYAASSNEEIRRALYENDERMKGFYLTALLFSFLFSSNYIAFYRFFRDRLIPAITGARAVCDVGCGHGVYLAAMLRSAPSAVGTGIDISPASLDTARELLGFHGVTPDRFRLLLGNAQERLPVEDASQDALTCFEVIEHLDRPEVAVGELRRILRPGGRACVSTALRMESVDHVHLFRAPQEVRGLITAQGFTIVDDSVIPLTTEDTSEPAVLQRMLADPRVSLGYVALLT